MRYSFILLLIFSFQALGFDKDFKVNEKMPFEFSLMFESLKLGSKTPKSKLDLVALCQDIDKNLGEYKKEHIFLLVKSEIIKGLLEHKATKVRQLSLTTLLVDRLEKDLVEKQNLLTPFSLWLWRSMLAELKNAREAGLITEKTFNARAFDGARLQQAQRLQRYLNYLLPWLDKMDGLNASQFNEYTHEQALLILERINERGLLFKRFASTLGGDERTNIFNIPQRLLNLHPEEIKQIKAQEDLTLKEKSEKEKTEAGKEVNKVTPEDLSPISDDVYNEVQKKAE